MSICINGVKILASLLFVFSFQSSAFAKEVDYAPTSVDMNPVQVSEHVWYVQGVAGIATDNEGFISNAGFIIADEGIVIFDALGTPSLAAKLLEKIREISNKPIVKVVVSHYHADHIYGLQVFEDEGAEIIAPVGVYEYLDSEAASSRLEERRFSLEPWVNDDTRLVIPSKLVDQDTSFTLGDVSFTTHFNGKAHSDGDQTLYVEPDRVLFTGDIIFEGRIPFLGGANTKNWLETLKHLNTEKLAALIPGHGPIAEKPAKAISLTLRYLAYMRKVMGEAAEELMEFDEAYATADWSEFESLPAFEAGNRRNAFQVFLSMEAE